MNKLKRIVLLILTIGISSNILAQDIKQTIRGTIVDRETTGPLPGATVILIGSDPLIGTTTGPDGEFRLDQVPVGRQTLRVSFIGYEEIAIPDILVSSAKESVIDIALTESVVKLGEVTILSKREKGKPINEMATVSARSFTVEETKRYPASISDPGRMVQAYAGVTVGDDASNEIIIRGNSPSGVLWRLEGVEIPGPNHFAEEGYSSGFVSILSSNLIATSDFFTGAFPAEYGNGYSGVFDINLRNGNNQKREYAFQFGTLGTDLALEGPFSKNYKGSYLINYRYSTLALLEAMNIGLIEDEVPRYQDLSFKLHLPTNNAGTFNIWGIGGLSASLEGETSDSTKWEYKYDRITWDFRTGMGAAGVTHIYSPTKNSFLKTVISYSGNYSQDDAEIYDTPDEKRDYYRDKYSNRTFRSSLAYNLKLNSRLLMKTGVIYSHLMYNMKAEGQDYHDEDIWRVYNEEKGNANLYQAFIQSKYRVSPELSLTAGVHALYFALNKKYSIEPRLGLLWQVNPKNSVGFGAGLHSRIEEMSGYFMREFKPDGSFALPNRNLNFRKSLHLVGSYSHCFNKNLCLKTEVYYQYLYDLAITKNPEHTFSVVNGKWSESYRAPMTNNGIGRNYGLELTFERYFSNHFYFIVTSSLFDSKYRAADGNWYDTRFNVRYASNFIIGKEFIVGKNKENLLGINGKFIWAGGSRETPIDMEASRESGEQVLIESQRNTIQNPDYLRMDASISYRLNKPKVSHILSFDVQNLTNRDNIMGSYYDSETQQTTTYYHLGILPILSYKIEF